MALRALILALSLVFSASPSALAFLPNGGGSDCPSPTTSGSTITPTNQTCTIVGTYLGANNFTSSVDKFGNYALHYTGAGGGTMGAGTQATLGPCNNGLGWQCVYWLQTLPLSIGQGWFTYFSYNL